MEHFEILVVAVMVVVNSFFAAYEIALASMSLPRLQLLAREKRSGAAAALAMKEGIEKSLAVVQLGITLVGLIAGATGGASAADDLAPYLQRSGFSESVAEVLAVALVVLPLTVATIIVGELLPKLFALRNKEWVCLTLSPLMQFFSISAWPVVFLLEFSASGLMELLERLWRPGRDSAARTEAVELLELRAIANLARTSRLIGPREENIILGAARLPTRTLREILLPAEHIRMLNLQDSPSDNLIAAHMDLHTRFPIAERRGDPQSIIGYATFKDVVMALKWSPQEPSVRGVMREIPSLQSEMPIAAALEFLLRERTHIALVRSPQGTVEGMITLEDIVEELVGDIQDEHDLLPLHVVRSGDGWIVGGGASLSRIRELTALELTPSANAANLSAWVIERLENPLSGGEVVADGACRIVVRKTRRGRVLEAALNVERRP